jgi:hypothetical protein
MKMFATVGEKAAPMAIPFDCLKVKFENSKKLL